jgi:pyruvate,water dikinase
MVDPTVAGTAFSVEVSTGYPAIHIAASYGLGEAVVSGQVTSDEWLIHPETRTVIKRVRGAKKEMCVTEDGKSGTIWVDVPAHEREKFCVEDTKIKEVAAIIDIIQKVYKSLFGYEHVDTEFAISKGNER